MPTFSEKVISVVKAIPRGHVLSYKEVARRSGNPRASRAVGSIMKKNYREDVPCHRVIRSDGKVGEYNRGAENKMKKLKNEGYLV
jgi:methylated-DNA-[protein]-cysteine S-methyltransferase